MADEYNRHITKEQTICFAGIIRRPWVADQGIVGEECFSLRKRFLVAHTIFVLLLFLVLLLSPCVIASCIDLQQEEEWLEEQANYD